MQPSKNDWKLGAKSKENGAQFELAASSSYPSLSYRG